MLRNTCTSSSVQWLHWDVRILTALDRRVVAMGFEHVRQHSPGGASLRPDLDSGYCALQRVSLYVLTPETEINRGILGRKHKLCSQTPVRNIQGYIPDCLNGFEEPLCMEMGRWAAKVKEEGEVARTEKSRRLCRLRVLVKTYKATVTQSHKCVKFGHLKEQRNLTVNQNVGQCPTWWPPCRI